MKTTFSWKTIFDQNHWNLFSDWVKDFNSRVFKLTFFPRNVLFQIFKPFCKEALQKLSSIYISSLFAERLWPRGVSWTVASATTQRNLTWNLERDSNFKICPQEKQSNYFVKGEKLEHTKTSVLLLWFFDLKVDWGNGCQSISFGTKKIVQLFKKAQFWRFYRRKGGEVIVIVGLQLKNILW